MRCPLAILAMTACGGAPAAEPTTPPPIAAHPVAPPPPAKPAVTPEAACARLLQLADEGCGNFKRLSIDPATCPAMFGAMMQEGGGANLARCMVQNATCGEVQACSRAANEVATKPEHLEDCAHHRPNAMVGIAAADYAQRHGAGATRLSALASSKEQPVETCGFQSEVTVLAALACDDGSQPVTGGMAAEKARVGDVGTGGRCNSIIDRYRVSCPERDYDVFIDAYLCPK